MCKEAMAVTERCAQLLAENSRIVLIIKEKHYETKLEEKSAYIRGRANQKGKTKQKKVVVSTGEKSPIFFFFFFSVSSREEIGSGES